MKHLIKTTLLLLAILLPTLTHAHDFEIDGIYYNINGTTATVTYKGKYSYSYSNEYSGDVTIPATVTYSGKTYSITTIGDNAFYDCSSLTKITIPNSVTNIGNDAFYNCSSLTTVNIPNSVTSIGNSAFSRCSSLTNINIPNSVTSIGYSAFSGCSSLTNINIPNSVTSIGNSTFSGCSSLNTINIPNSVTSIGHGVFWGCSNLTNINIPNSVTTVGEGAFSGTAWFDNQPDGLVYAGLVAYRYKGNMPEGTSITIREGTTSISGSAFSGCSSLANINIPNSVTSIGYSAFSGTAWFDNQPDGLVYAGLVAYKYKGNMPEGTSITIKEGTKGIADEAFSGCSNLATINIPNSVTSIGGEAFHSCSSLTNINIPNSVTSIDGCAFYGCSRLTNVNIGNSVTYIGIQAFFDCSSLTNINIPNSITSIGDEVFSGCYSLTTIDIPNSVTSIGQQAFYECRSLATVNIPNTVTNIGDEVFSGCYSLTNINIPNSVTFISEGTFSGCSNLTTINIPNSVTSIGEGAFCCSGLTNINIPNSVTSIGSYAFGGTRLTTVNIPYSVSIIGNSAFSECFSLNEVYCYSTTPPECNDEGYAHPTFLDYSATLHVPAASLAAYFTAPVWSKFENIVGDAVAPTGIAISRDSVEIQSGEEIELTATVTPANASCKDVTWYSTDTSVATVEDGVVTAIGYGECDIFAYCMGMPAVCHITVSNRISLGQQEAMLLPNHMLTLTPTAPVMPNDFTATSSDPTVAAVRVMNGKVQVVGIKEGTTTITVGSTDGTATPAICLVTVYTEPGDVNCDGYSTINDVTLMIDYLLGGGSTNIKIENADVNGDGKVSVIDITNLIDLLLSGDS